MNHQLRIMWLVMEAWTVISNVNPVDHMCMCLKNAATLQLEILLPHKTKAKAF